ncbi:MAG: hypothetical protein AAF664_23265, partial [Planctomycetota bacterium]
GDYFFHSMNRRRSRVGLAILIGSVAPDVPLYLLSFGGLIWFRWFEGWDWPEVGRHMYANLFYNDPIWISLHNLLHSPLVLVTVLAFLLSRRPLSECRRSAIFWFFASCLLHTLVDIPVHYDDGPLIFWPLNWQYRFASPVSYWDFDHHARPVVIAELALWATFVLWTLYRLVVRKFVAENQST